MANRLEYNQPVVLLGSCFAQHMGKKLSDAKWLTTVNPGGIVFDPLSLCRQMEMANQLNNPLPQTYFNEQELWHSWNHHSTISAYSEQELIDHIHQANLQLRKGIQESALLVVTLGTAFVYFHQASQMPVANCHKVPASNFTKQRLSLAQITEALNQFTAAVLEMNPAIQIMVTVSPVKHVRDGVVENMRSKALLLEAAHQWCERYSDNVQYFPAYEWVAEVLRDHRFYEADLAHPNQQAIDIIFDSFVKTCLSNKAQQYLAQILQFNQGMLHKPHFPQTKAYQSFLEAQRFKLNELEQVLPFLNWETEKSQLG